MILLLLCVFPTTAGDVALTLSGENPLSVEVRGTGSNEEAGSISIYLYFRDDGVTDLDIGDVNDDELEITMGWSTDFRTQEIQTGSWYRNGEIFTRRLYYDNAGINSLDDYWSTSGDTALICTFSAVGSGHTFIEVNGADGLADWAGSAHDINVLVPPYIPELSITGVSPTECQLSWQPVLGASTYDLYRGTSAYFTPGTAWHTVAAPDTSYIFPEGVGDPDVTYYFICRAVGSGGESGDSESVGEFEFLLP